MKITMLSFCLISALIMLLFVGCAQTQTETVNNNPIPTTEVPANDYEGTYSFDTQKYKQVQLLYKDSLFQKMSPEDVDRMMKIFQPFKIEIQGGEVRAAFSQDIVRGTLKEVSRSAQETRLKMIPVDDDKKKETVELIIRGNQMILDPGKKEIDKMFFTRIKTP
ncbi:MAG: hypothetical protein ABII18_02415 [bacterium]